MKILLVLLICSIFYSYPLCAVEQSNHFTSYNDIFSYIAKNEDLPDYNNESIMKLAGDSSIDIIQKQDNLLLIIKPNFYKQIEERFWHNIIRGASDNGNYYIFKWEYDIYEFIGIMKGNAYKIQYTTINGKNSIRFITALHMSAM